MDRQSQSQESEVFELSEDIPNCTLAQFESFLRHPGWKDLQAQISTRINLCRDDLEFGGAPEELTAAGVSTPLEAACYIKGKLKELRFLQAYAALTLNAYQREEENDGPSN
jgi:hypothetical protein